MHPHISKTEREILEKELIYLLTRAPRKVYEKAEERGEIDYLSRRLGI